mgnify:CR=1 FL=1
MHIRLLFVVLHVLYHMQLVAGLSGFLYTRNVSSEDQLGPACYQQSKRHEVCRSGSVVQEDGRSSCFFS